MIRVVVHFFIKDEGSMDLLLFFIIAVVRDIAVLDYSVEGGGGTECCKGRARKIIFIRSLDATSAVVWLRTWAVCFQYTQTSCEV